MVFNHLWNRTRHLHGLPIATLLAAPWAHLGGGGAGDQPCVSPLHLLRLLMPCMEVVNVDVVRVAEVDVHRVRLALTSVTAGPAPAPRALLLRAWGIVCGGRASATVVQR